MDLTVLINLAIKVVILLAIGYLAKKAGLLPEAVEKACAKIGILPKELDAIVPHQANIRIIETAAKNLDVEMDKFPMYIAEYGNTSSASIPIAFCEAVKDGRIKHGDKICLVGFGGGLTYGAAIFEY